jgi:hypothetical protein
MAVHSIREYAHACDCNIEFNILHSKHIIGVDIEVIFNGINTEIDNKIGNELALSDLLATITQFLQ